MDWSFRRIRPHCLVAGASAIGQLACVCLGTFATTAAAQAPRTTRGAATAQAGSSYAGKDDGDAKRGKDLYIKNACYQCHGYEGQGGSSAGVRLAPDPLPPEAMAAVIRRDNGMMPPFTAKLVPDQDVADIVAYLRTVIKPTDIKNIPDFKK